MSDLSNLRGLLSKGGYIADLDRQSEVSDEARAKLGALAGDAVKTAKDSSWGPGLLGGFGNGYMAEAGGANEALKTLGSGFVSLPLSGIAGLSAGAGALAGGSSWEDALRSGREAVDDTTRRFTYEPKTAEGIRITGNVGRVMGGIGRAAGILGDAVADSSGSPALGAIAATAGEMAGPGGGKGKGAKGAVMNARPNEARIANIMREHGVPREVAAAMSTARPWESTAVSKYVGGAYEPGKVSIADLGAGKDPKAALSLREAGHNVTPYDYWGYTPEGRSAGIHATEPLPGGADVVSMSNVLNVQSNPDYMDALFRRGTEGRHAAFELGRPDSDYVFNYPASPRYQSLDPSAMEALLRERYFRELERVGGSSSEPIWRGRSPIIPDDLGAAAAKTEADMPAAPVKAPTKKAQAEAAKAERARLAARDATAEEQMTPELAALSNLRAGALDRNLAPPMKDLWKDIRLAARADPEAVRAAAEAGVHLQPDGKGGFIGAPQHIRSAEDAMAAAQRGVDLITEPYPWYEVQGPYRKALAPSAGDKNGYLAGVWSNQAGPGTELMRDAEVRIARASQGPEKGRLTKPMVQAQTDAAMDIMEGAPAGPETPGLGAKTLNYGEELNGRRAANVADRHEATANEFDFVGQPKGKAAGLGDPQHSYAHGQGYASVRLMEERLAKDPDLAARWKAAYGDMMVDPERIQESRWRDIKIQKDAADLVSRGWSQEEALAEATRNVDADPMNKFTETAPRIAVKEAGIDPGWQAQGTHGNYDRLLDAMGVLQEPGVPRGEARPLWGPASFADETNTHAGAHGPHDINQQRLKTGGKWAKEKDGSPKLKQGKPYAEGGHPFSREEHIASGAVDQEGFLKDTALIRQWLEGRESSDLSYRGRHFAPEGLEDALANPGQGIGARRVVEALDRHPGIERLLTPDALVEPLGDLHRGRADVMRGRKLAGEEGMAGIRAKVARDGGIGLLGLAALLGLPEDASASEDPQHPGWKDPSPPAHPGWARDSGMPTPEEQAARKAAREERARREATVQAWNAEAVQAPPAPPPPAQAPAPVEEQGMLSRLRALLAGGSRREKMLADASRE